MTRFNIKAIAIGVAIDVGGTFAAALVFLMMYTAVLMAQGITDQEVIQERIMADPTYWVASLILGLAFVGTGAWVTGRLAREREVTHAALMGFVTMIVGLLFLLTPDTPGMELPAWYLPVSFGCTMPTALAGGWVAAIQRARAGSA